MLLLKQKPCRCLADNYSYKLPYLFFNLSKLTDSISSAYKKIFGSFVYCQCNITIGVEEDDQLLYGRSSCVAATIELGALLKGHEGWEA